MRHGLGTLKITILDRYIFRELFTLFFTGLSIVMAILYLEKIHFLSRLILDHGVTFSEFAELLFYVSPAFLMVALPLSLLLSSLVTFARLSTDNEITAMRACGIGFQRFLAPVLFIALLVYSADFYLTVNLQHVGNLRYMKLLRKIITEKITLTLGERVFFDKIKNTVIYVNEKPADGDTLKGVFLYDSHNTRNPKYITAEEGKFVNINNSVVLQLRNGTIYNGNPQTFRTTSYETYELVFNTELDKKSHYVFQPREMSIEKIKARIAKRMVNGGEYFGDQVEVYKRYSIPFSCIVLALLGAPLGIRSQGGGKTSGMGFGLILIISNYLLLMLAEGLGREGKIPPIISMWIPNIILGTLAIYLIYITSKEITPKSIAVYFKDLLQKATGKDD